MTYAETVAKIKAAGYQGEPTPEVVKQFGWTPGNPLEDVELEGPAVTREELNMHLSALQEEAKANSVPMKVLAGIKTVVGLAARFTP